MNGTNKIATAGSVVLFALFVLGFKLLTREAVREVVNSATAEPEQFPVAQTPIKPVAFQPVAIQPVNFKPTGLIGVEKAPAGKTPTGKAPAGKEAAVTPARNSTGALLQQWAAPSEANFKPDDLLNPARITDLAFHRDGDRLLSVSKAGVHVWKVETGKLLDTFRAVKEPALVSRDGRYAAIPSETAVTIFNTATGQPTGKYNLDAKQILAQRWARGGGAFSPSGELLLLTVSQVANEHVLVLDSRSGAANKLKIPAAGRTDLRLQYEQLEPIAGGPNLLLNGYAIKPKAKSYVNAFNTETQKQTELTAIPFKPWTLDPHRGLRSSIDGRYVASHDPKSVVVVDRITDRLVLTVQMDMTQFSEPTFTPDCTRVVFVRHPQFYTFTIGGPRVYPSDTVELFDVKSGKKLGSLDTENSGFAKHLTSVEVSHDGKKLAVAAGSRVAVFDFEAAFGVAPLPPKSLPTEAEQYPVE